MESDETLDILTFYMFVEWNSERGPNNGELIPYTKDKINELKLTDFGMMLPADSYIVIWDKDKPVIDFSEYLSKATKVFNPTNEYDFIKVVCKGHDFNFIYDKFSKLKRWRTFNDREYYPFVHYKRSTKPAVTPEMVLRVWGIGFKNDVNINENDAKILCIREYLKRLYSDVEDADDIINNKISLINTDFTNVKDIIKNIRIEREVN